MARPAKSVKVKTGAITTAENNLREETERKLRGKPKEPEPPPGLVGDQLEIFRFIVRELVESEILGALDVFVLESTAVAVSRLRKINAMIEEDDSLLLNTALQGAKAKYQSDLWRGCNELCLSPQARAKIGSLAAQAARERADPLLAALTSDD